MRRCAALLLLALLLLAPAARAEDLRHVEDLAGLFGPAETADLEARMRAVYEEFNFDSVILTSDEVQTKPAHLYAADYFEEFRDLDRYPDGVLFYINVNPAMRDYNEVAHGRGMTLLGDRSVEELETVVLPFLSAGDFYGAASAYLRYLEDRLTPTPPMEVAVRILPWLAGVGFLIGLISVTVMKGRLKTAKPQTGASRYMLRDSLRLTDSKDIYLYETVTRTKVESDSHRGGGSSGGFRFSSSSGRSFSSRGGKF